MSFSVPSHARIALALIVLRSKPSAVSVEDYLGQIRAIIVNRARKESIYSHNYIDATLFWKQAYERLESEKGKLQDRLFELEHTQHRERSISIQIQTLPQKRPEALSGNKANTQTKRRKLDQCSAQEDFSKDDQEHFEAFSPGCQTLPRLMFMVRAQISSEDSNPIQLCQIVSIASHTSRKLLATFCHDETSTQKVLPGQPNIDEFFRVITKLWACLLDALKTIEELEVDRCKDCVPGMVSLFQALLGQVQQNCLDEADQHIRARRRQKSKNKTSLRASCTGTDMSSEKRKERCLAIAQACCKMLSTLKLDSKMHCLLLEGITCALFDHIGSSMSLMIFVEAGISMKRQSGVLPPCGLLDVAHIDSDTALLTSQLAGPYLVLILKETLKVANNLNDKQRRSLLGLSQPMAEQCGTLTEVFRQRLQNTLLRGVYGDEDVTFEKALNRSAEPDEAGWEQIMEDMAQKMDKSEWFIGQVWEHLGWDVLSAA